jgi:3-oxoacyl-[acyl-carrier-protein] synthase-1
VPPFSSTKSLTGHSLGATGVQEAIYCLIMLKQGFIAGSANIERSSPPPKACRWCGTVGRADLRTALSNSFGFGGTNASLHETPRIVGEQIPLTERVLHRSEYRIT